MAATPAKNCQHVVDCRHNNKRRLVEWMGGKCCKCGYDKPFYTVYHFHHTDASTKSFTVSKYMSRSIDSLKEECKKCQLLCGNCHAEIHDQKYTESRERTAKQLNITRRPRRPLTFKECCGCSNSYRPKYATQQYCSRQCRIDDLRSKQLNRPVPIPRQRKRKVQNRPTKEVLENQIQQLGYRGTGRLYGVSDNAVRKWRLATP